MMKSHAYALEVSGFTVLREQVAEHTLAELRDAAERALAAACGSAQRQKSTGSTDYYHCVRCMYCWSESCRRLLEHDSIHELSSMLIDNYHLWDLSVLSA